MQWAQPRFLEQAKTICTHTGRPLTHRFFSGWYMASEDWLRHVVYWMLEAKPGQGHNDSEAHPYSWNPMSWVIYWRQKEKERMGNNKRKGAIMEGGHNEPVKTTHVTHWSSVIQEGSVSRAMKDQNEQEKSMLVIPSVSWDWQKRLGWSDPTGSALHFKVEMRA